MLRSLIIFIYNDPVDLYASVNGNDKALASVDFAGFYQVSPFRVDLYNYIWCFYFKSPGIYDISGKNRSTWSCGFIKGFVKVGKLLFLDSALLQQGLIRGSG